jgi:hypothetical protein
MSRTFRNKPYKIFRKPKTFNQIRNTEGLLTDERIEDVAISKTNRMRRHIPTAWDDIPCSAYKQLQ